MAIFNFLASKAPDDQERKTFSPNPHKRLFSGLDAKSEELKRQHPDDVNRVDDFIRALKETYKIRSKRTPGRDLEPISAEACYFLTTDRMNAYACVLPPENGGVGITLEEFLEDLRYEGISHGILQEEIQPGLSEYFRLFPIARGTPPQPGEDGKVTELFRRRENMCLDPQDEGQVDFGQDIPLQPIQRGVAICKITPAKAGTDGMDVTGRKIACPESAAANIPQGKNTAVSVNGQKLTASVDGILYIKDGLFCIHEQKIINGDLDHFQGTLRVSGNLYIGGNVDGDVDIEASGDVVINGKLQEARISSGGTIRIQQGIFGTSGKTVLKAARQVQSPVVKCAEVSAGTCVVSEMISNSTIQCSGTVYALSGRGMITSSEIRAGESILCLRIGNLAGDRSQFSIGYPPHVPEEWSKRKTELAEMQETIKKIWGTITELRRKGTHISDREKMVLDQLVIQRDLYTKRRDDLSTEISNLEKALNKKCAGRIQCEKLYPILAVQIGRLTEEITAEMENCNIHAVGNRIALK